MVATIIFSNKHRGAVKTTELAMKSTNPAKIAQSMDGSKPSNSNIWGNEVLSYERQRETIFDANEATESESQQLPMKPGWNRT